MDENGNRSLDGIVAELKEILKDIDRREQEAAEALAAVQAERRSIGQMIRAAERTGVYSKKKSGGSNAPSPETIEVAWQKLLAASFKGDENNPGSFTAADMEKAGIKNAPRILNALRDQGRIRLVGQRFNDPGKGGRAAATYMISV